MEDRSVGAGDSRGRDLDYRAQQSLNSYYCCGFPQLGQNFPALGIGFPHSTQNLLPAAAAGPAEAGVSSPPLVLGFMLFIIVCAMPMPTPHPAPRPAPPPSFSAAIGMDL